jgi:hypothetical protein
MQLYKQWRLHLVLQEGVGEKSAKQEKDEMIMGLLLEEVLPKATTLYIAGPLQVRPNIWGSPEACCWLPGSNGAHRAVSPWQR